jgi:DNA-binding MarR family transcriptional regulator
MLTSWKICRYNNLVNSRDEEEESRSPSVERATAEIARDCVAVRWRRLNRVLTNLYDGALRPLGLKVSQMNLLVAAERLGVAEPSEVSRILEIDLSTLSRNVERLRARGWIEAVPDRDARVHPFRVTEAGRELIRRAYPLWKEAQQKAIALLGEEGVMLLDRAARRRRPEDREG